MNRQLEYVPQPKLKDDYHTQGTQWVENNSSELNIKKGKFILSRPAHSEFHCIVLH